jgi:hypothetical protein
MSFLALTGLQAAMLALITSGAIVAFYLLKLRHRRVLIASSYLWKRVLDEREARSLWEKLRKVVSILLAVTIGLLLALAIGRPEIPGITGNASRWVLVMDTSPTLLTRTRDGGTRWNHARETALEMIRSSAPSALIRVADTSGLVDSGFTSDRLQLQHLVERMSPRFAAGKFPEIDDLESTEVRYISDGVSEVDVPSRTVRLSVFEPAENTGITAFEVRSMPSSPLAYEAYLEVFNFGRQPQTVDIAISGAGRQRITRQVQLRPGQEFSEPFDLTLFEGGPVRATVQSRGDALGIDDTAYAYLPVKRKTRTLLVTPGNPYLETLLGLHSLVDLTVIKPGAFVTDTNYDVCIFDHFAPIDPPSRPALILGNLPNVSWLPRSTATLQAPKFSTWSDDHPVMRFVALHDVGIQRARRIDGTGFTVLAETEGRNPLIVASPPVQRPRWVLLAFSLDGSDFPLQRAFPLFIDNTLAWFSREPFALRRQPGLVEIDIPAARIKALDGEEVASHGQVDGTVFEASQPGLYLAANDDIRQYVAVNLSSRLYSNVNGNGTAPAPASLPIAVWFQQELWFYMLLIAAALLTLEWFTYHRRITL